MYYLLNLRDALYAVFPYAPKHVLKRIFTLVDSFVFIGSAFFPPPPFYHMLRVPVFERTNISNTKIVVVLPLSQCSKEQKDQDNEW